MTKTILSTEQKFEWCRREAAAGLSDIEVTSFVSPKLVPQFADAGEVARLALIGVEAKIQTTTLPDKGVWHRVRVGPYTSVEALNRTRDTLKQNGVETALIKVRE